MLYLNGFGHRIAKRSPDSGNRLEIIRNIVRESYKMRNVFPKNDRELLQIYLIISNRVNQQTSKEKLSGLLDIIGVLYTSRTCRNIVGSHKK